MSNSILRKERLVISIKLSLLCAIFFAVFFYMSFAAEPFSQEGYGTTILGYNRDFLVDSRWWFFGGLLSSILIFLYGLLFGVLKSGRRH